MSRRGFTLLEVLVTMVILGVMILASLSVLYQRKVRMARSAEVVLAYQALANEAELVRHQSFGALQPGRRDYFDSDGAILEALLPYESNRVIADVRPGVREVRLEIVWRDGQARAAVSILRTDTGGSNLW